MRLMALAQLCRWAEAVLMSLSQIKASGDKGHWDIGSRRSETHKPLYFPLLLPRPPARWPPHELSLRLGALSCRYLLDGIQAQGVPD